MKLILATVLTIGLVLTAAIPRATTAAAQKDPLEISILVTGDAMSYTVPCGCGGSKSGGIARQATFIKEHLESNPNTIIIDSGNNAHNVRQAEIFFAAKKLMGYAGVGVGGPEAAIGDSYYAAAREAGVTIVAPEAEGVEGVVPYLVKDVGGVKLGIVAFNALRAEIDTLETSRKRVAAYSAAREESDVLVVIDQGFVVTDDWLQGLGKRLGEPDIVLPGYKYSPQTGARKVGKTNFSPPSSKGYHVGVFTVRLQSGQEPNVEFSRTEMTEHIADEPEVAKLVDDYMKNRGALRLESPVQQTSQVEPLAAQLSGFQVEAQHNPDTCKSCHKSQYNSWAKSKHAFALESLKKKERMVPECLKCHSEIFRQSGSLTASGSLSNGVVCASCHYTVLPHQADYKAKGRAVEDVNTCLVCHDRLNSPNFDEKTYWPRAAHVQ